ncbi:acyl-CoA thioesterase [Virgibacillus sp. W0430]|uniref:acyl-CoA thioesterase n=1 Tax=Virgibacillus sp. W0430 TaxID=3391580 RepID=UPI003F487036
MTVVKTPIEVRYQETDQMGVVYHANYLVWFEIGRTKFVESLGFAYTDMEKDKIVSPVIDVHISYKHPVRYGDKIYVETWLEKYDGIRTVYRYNVIDENKRIAVTGKTTHVIVHKDTFKPLALKRMYPNWHDVYKKALKDTKHGVRA